MFKAPAFHQSAPGSNPRVYTINVGLVCCCFSSPLHDVFPRVLWVSSHLKTQHFRIPVQRRMTAVVDEQSSVGYFTGQNNKILFDIKFRIKFLN